MKLCTNELNKSITFALELKKGVYSYLYNYIRDSNRQKVFVLFESFKNSFLRQPRDTYA